MFDFFHSHDHGPDCGLTDKALKPEQPQQRRQIKCEDGLMCAVPQHLVVITKENRAQSLAERNGFAFTWAETGWQQGQPCLIF